MIFNNLVTILKKKRRIIKGEEKLKSIVPVFRMDEFKQDRLKDKVKKANKK